MRVCLAAIGLLLAGCQDYIFVVVPAWQVKEHEAVHAAGDPIPADILFVVDNSGSMADEQQNLARNFGAFINEIAGTGNYQIGIVTTDVKWEGGERQGLSSSTFKSDHPFTVNTIDSTTRCSLAGIPHGCFRGPGAMESRMVRSTLDRSEQIVRFGQNVNVGSCGHGEETGLEGMILALRNTGPGECNEGFLREGANLVVVIVSDEEDHSNIPIAGFVAGLKAFKDPSQIRIAAIVGSEGGEAKNCRVDAPSCGSLCDNRPSSREDLAYWQTCYSCSYYNAPDCCNAEGGGRYVRFAREMEAEIIAAAPQLVATGCRPTEAGTGRIACLIDSICQEEFGETLTRIARDLIVAATFVLDPKPCSASAVAVDVNGVPVPKEGYEVDPDLSKVTLKGVHTPKPGDDVQVHYIVEGCDSP